MATDEQIRTALAVGDEMAGEVLTFRAGALKTRSEVVERKTKRPPKTKYRDPEHPENTWTGKGRPPKWLQEKLDQGLTKDQFLIA